VRETKEKRKGQFGEQLGRSSRALGRQIVWQAFKAARWLMRK